MLQVPGYTPPPLPSDAPTSTSDSGTSATPAPAADPTFDPAPPSAEATTTPTAPAADDVLGDDVLGDDVLAAPGSTIAAPVVAEPAVAAQAVEEAVPAQVSVEEPAAVDAPTTETFETFDASSSVDEPAESFVVDETSGTLADVS